MSKQPPVSRLRSLARWLKPILVIVAAVLVAGCGGESVPDSADAKRQAEQVAERTQELANEVRDSARDLAEDPQAGDAVVERLKGQREEAEQLAERAEDELPDPEASEALARANERTGEAVESLEEYAESRDDGALKSAHEALEQEGVDVDRAAKELGDQLSPSARERIEKLRREAPALPGS